MNPLERFEQLASLARQEQAPAIDVTARVLRAISCPEDRRDLDLPLMIGAGLSAAAASIVSALALDAWSVLTHPLAVLFQPLLVVIQ